MVDTGWVLAGTGASDSTVGDEVWANPSNVTVDDTAVSDGAPDKDEQMEYIKATNFGLDIPTGATIDGIEIRARLIDNSGASDVSDITHAVVYHPSSGYGSDLEASTTAITTSAVNYDYGGASELWGGSWTVANIEDSTFGFSFSLNQNELFNPSDPQCEAMFVKVYYTAALVTTGRGYVIG